jgi:hypothetical protein
VVALPLLPSRESALLGYVIERMSRTERHYRRALIPFKRVFKAYFPAIPLLLLRYVLFVDGRIIEVVAEGDGNFFINVSEFKMVARVIGSTGMVAIRLIG